MRMNLLEYDQRVHIADEKLKESVQTATKFLLEKESIILHFEEKLRISEDRVLEMEALV